MKNRLMTAVALALLGGGLLAGSSAFAATGDTGASFDKVTSTAVTAREFHEDSLAATAPNAPAAIAPYCTNTYTSGVEPITLVKINDIDNASAANATVAHEDFTAVLGTLRPGAPYAVTMKSNTGGAFTHGHALYVDWNQNGVFTDPGEGYWIGTINDSTGTDTKEVTAYITVPAGATLGPTRMRAMTRYNVTALSGLLPCNTAGYGQSEDYTVTLDPLASVPPAPPLLTADFAPELGPVPASTTLTLTLSNATDALATTTADFVTSLPAGMTLAADATTTCAGSLTGASGGDTITLATGATLAPGTSCVVSASVAVATAGSSVVSSGPLTTAEGSVSAVATFFGWDDSGSTGVATGFESPFTIGAINGQQSWYANSTANVISSVNPANGSQHYRLTSTTSGGAFALSPNFAAGTTRYISASANIRINNAGAYLEFTPQDPANAAVTTRIRFSGAASRDIQTVDWSASSYVPTGETWPLDTYFEIKLLVDRVTDNVRICKDGTQIYETTNGSGTTGFNNVENFVLSQTSGTGQTAARTYDVDDLDVSYTPSYECDGSLPPVTHTVTPSVGTPSGSISPNTAQTVVDGATATFTLAADTGYEIDTVGGSCGGTLTGTSYTTNAITGDCTVIANFKALPVIHTVTPSVGTPSGAISPNTAQMVNDGSNATFTLTADAGYEIDNVGGDCPAGSFAGNDYTTGAITADCTVVANFKAVPASTHVRISQIYGGGGNTGATFNAKYVELFNPGSSAVALTGMSVQYAAPAGTNWSGRVNLTGTIGAHSYFLVQLGSGANGAPMPVTPDQTSTSFSPGGTNGNLALANVTTALACQTTACASDPQVVDLVGFGTGAAFEGTAAAPATSATLAAFRAGDGCIDSNDNAADFSAATPAPRNSTSPANTCGAPPVTHTVTPSVGTPSGAISPNTAQTVNDGDTAAFTLTPDAGFEIDAVGGTCGGTLDTGTSVYTTAAVTADCTVVANFKAIVVPGDPIIDVTPASLSASQEPNQTTTQTLLIENIGGSDLNWGIEEGLPRGTGTGTAERMSPRLATPRQPAPRDWALAPMAEVVQDGGFEAGDPNPFWTVASLNFGSPLCTAALCGTGGGLGPRTGTWWTWLGGIAAVETASVQQDLTISAGGPATLSFWLNVSATSGDASDYMAVLIDSNEVFRVTADNVAAYASGYAQVVIDVSAYADDAVHTLKFDSSFAGTDVTNFMVDDVSLDAGAPPVSGCTAGDILPWASVDTGSGTIAAGGNATVTVTFDSTGLAVGTYSGLLCVNSNDPVNPQVEVPVELTVAPPAGGLVCFSQSHPVAQTFDGTYVRWEDNTFSDTGSITGSNFNPYGATQLSFFWPNSSTGNAGVASATTGGTWLVLNPGDTVGPASTFNTATTGATNWRAGADGYLGFRFACSTASACYGYAHMTTVAPDGYPAVIGDYCFDSTGAAITIPGGIPRHTVTPSVGSPSGTITPDTPQLVDEGTTAAFTLSPALGYHILDVTGTCGGTLAGNTFTTDAVMADCTVVANFEINAAGTDPVIGVTPAAGFSVSQNTNMTTTDTLTIGNSGGGDLNWTIKEENLPRPLSAMPVVERVQQAAQERVGSSVTLAAPANSSDSLKPLQPQAPEAVLYDNGPLITNAGAGAGGADVSALQTAVGNSIYGSNVSVSGGFRVADDFAVPAGGWMVDAITVFAYQTGSTTTSTMNAANLRIWDGVPGAAGSNIVFGDTTTNRLAATAFSGIYRTLDTDLTNADRPIMSVDISVGAILPEGTYWVDWQLGGSLASGPWAPAVTLSGQTGKPGANALQWDGTAWVAATDDGSMAAQDYPFQVNGTPAGGAPACTYLSSIPWLSASPATGTTAAAGSTAVTFTFDSTGVAIGSYAGNICVESNDPANPMVAVPVALDVVPVGATFTVTPSVGAGNGAISPSTAVIVDENGTTAFTLTPGAGYQLGTVGGTCGGTLAGNVFTTAPVTADCSVIANFDAIFPAPYCNVAFPSAVEPISRVVFTGIDNPSDPTVGGSPALENFLSVTGGVVSLDGLYDIAVEGNTGGNYTTKVRAYIDWNQNGSFADAGEMYNLSDLVNSTGADGKQATGSIVVPATATLGTTRMRVIKKFNTAADPCNTAGYGQAEDYTLTVNNDPLPQPEAQVSPISLSLTAQVGTSDTGTLTVSNVGPGRLTFNITRALPEAQGTPESMRGESVTRATVESLAARAAKLGSTLPFAVQDDLIGAYARGGDLPQFGNAILANDPLCDVGTPGLVVHDGNGAPDNGYGWNTTAGTDAKIVDKFTPSAYPASYSTVCVSLLTNAGLTSAPVQVVVFADDGAGGAPGTELGRVSATANNISSTLDQSFQAIDISGMGLNIASGSVYIGLEWNAETVSGLYLASDETTAVDAGGYSYSGGAWGATADGFPNYKSMFIRAIEVAAGPPGTGCGSPSAISWLSAAPLSGTINGPGSVAVTVTANAASLAVGTHQALLCVNTNDLAAPQFEIPVTFTVTPLPPAIFSDGFEGDDPPVDPNIVTGMINLPVALGDGDGLTMDFAAGLWGTYDPGRSDNVNLYDYGDGTLSVYWYGDVFTGVGGVVDGGGTEFAVLGSGATVGPASTISAASLKLVNWVGGVDGYLGFAFINSSTSQVNYGYIRMTTVSPGGLPAQVLEYGYNSAGAAITIP
ncbi:MAG TPA: GEVED domain-containing protein [Chiayiivirga sp.]|nr:GEVED domain-containing protein [Chiayiivirga sp.]